GNVLFAPREGQGLILTRDGKELTVGTGSSVLDFNDPGFTPKELPHQGEPMVMDLGDPGFTPKELPHQGEPMVMDLGDPGFTPKEQPKPAEPKLDLTVVRDASGHPTMINYANGRDSRTIDYDADGNPTRVATKDSEWRKEGDKWKEYDANGEKKPVSANSI